MENKKRNKVMTLFLTIYSFCGCFTGPFFFLIITWCKAILCYCIGDCADPHIFFILHCQNRKMENVDTNQFHVNEVFLEFESCNQFSLCIVNTIKIDPSRILCPCFKSTVNTLKPCVIEHIHLSEGRHVGYFSS